MVEQARGQGADKQAIFGPSATPDKFMDALNRCEKDLVELFKKVQLHENQLQIMVDEVNQEKMEAAYLDTHNDLAKKVLDYFVRYRDAKNKMFDIVSKVMKRRRQKRLLN
nr:hypothetical protein [uncultured Allomuricauda sp.]